MRTAQAAALPGVLPGLFAIVTDLPSFVPFRYGVDAEWLDNMGISTVAPAEECVERSFGRSYLLLAHLAAGETSLNAALSEIKIMNDEWYHLKRALEMLETASLVVIESDAGPHERIYLSRDYWFVFRANEAPDAAKFPFLESAREKFTWRSQIKLAHEAFDENCKARARAVSKRFDLTNPDEHLRALKHYQLETDILCALITGRMKPCSLRKFAPELIVKGWASKYLKEIQDGLQAGSIRHLRKLSLCPRYKIISFDSMISHASGHLALSDAMTRALLRKTRACETAYDNCCWDEFCRLLKAPEVAGNKIPKASLITLARAIRALDSHPFVMLRLPNKDFVLLTPSKASFVAPGPLTTKSDSSSGGLPAHWNSAETKEKILQRLDKVANFCAAGRRLPFEPGIFICTGTEVSNKAQGPVILRNPEYPVHWSYRSNALLHFAIGDMVSECVGFPLSEQTDEVFESWFTPLLQRAEKVRGLLCETERPVCGTEVSDDVPYVFCIPVDSETELIEIPNNVSYTAGIKWFKTRFEHTLGRSFSEITSCQKSKSRSKKKLHRLDKSSKKKDALRIKRSSERLNSDPAQLTTAQLTTAELEKIAESIFDQPQEIPEIVNKSPYLAAQENSSPCPSWENTSSPSPPCQADGAPILTATITSPEIDGQILFSVDCDLSQQYHSEWPVVREMSEKVSEDPWVSPSSPPKTSQNLTKLQEELISLIDEACEIDSEVYQPAGDASDLDLSFLDNAGDSSRLVSEACVTNAEDHPPMCGGGISEFEFFSYVDDASKDPPDVSALIEALSASDPDVSDSVDSCATEPEIAPAPVQGTCSDLSALWEDASSSVSLSASVGAVFANLQTSESPHSSAEDWFSSRGGEAHQGLNKRASADDYYLDCAQPKKLKAAAASA